MAVELEDTEGTAEAGPSRTADDDSLLRKLTRWERHARNHWSKWREEARLCYDFVAGHQWSTDDKRALLDQMRQPVTFNRVGPMVDAVIGAEILNRQETRYSPREIGDVQVNELITAADQWARDLADTEDEESDAFADAVICGMGWTETRMDYTEDPEGRLVDERIDPLEMWVDPNVRRHCCADARFIIRARWREKDDLPERWLRKIQAVGEQSGSHLDDPQKGWTGPRDDYDRDDEPAEKPRDDADKRRVWIRHIQWWDLEPAWRIADPTTGQAATLTRKELQQLARMYLEHGMRPPQAVKIEQKRFKQAFLCGNEILEVEDIEANEFTFKAITGKRDRNSNTFYGVVRSMIDPQMWGNKFFVQIMHIINTSAKGGLFYEADALVNPRKALEDWAKPDAAIEVKRGGLTGPGGPAVQERTPKTYPQGLDRLMEFTLNNLPQVSGINMELLGLVERDQPGVLEAQRKKAGYAILARFFDSLRRYRKMKGRTRLFFIQNYISDGRLIRIKGEDSTMQYVPLVKQPGTAQYDVIVDEAPMSPNQKEMVWQMMMGLMPMLSKLNVPPEVWGLMLEYSPLPSIVSEKINAALQQQAQQPPPPDPRVMQIEAKMQADQQKAQLDAQAKQQDMQQDREKHELEIEAKIRELELQAEEAQLQLQTAREKAAIQQQTAEHRAMMQMLPKPQNNDASRRRAA